ncbi:HD-GYP domain-containing protein [Actinopolymorpha alba]|uniref:HD-GYP domain-containing protein n=1 Tax=Actinopolymorpha alba TaxID=533267 RepID=UPI00038237D9|nr:HD-GYP domain-containing protein [Actinopolymorpha alba]
MPSRATRAYVVGLCAVGGLVSVLSLLKVDRPTDVVWFGLLVYLTERLKSRLGHNVLASLASVVAVATYPVIGMWGAPALLASALVRRHGLNFYKRGYNVAQNVICTFLGGAVYVALGGEVGPLAKESFPYLLVPISAAIVTWHATNVLLLAAVLRLDTGVSPRRSIGSNFGETFVSFIGYSYLGLLLAVLWLGQWGPIAGVLLVAPLLVARWAFAQYAAEQKAHQATLQALAQAIETKDLYTRGHGERVSRAARMLGAEMGWDGERLEAVAEAGLLHDVGKIGVPTRVLQKDGRLTEEEFDSIKLHPLHGVEVVGDIAFLEDARAGIMHHHERYDGTGYPSGLRGTDIPIFARVLSISDAFDCMTSVRSYRAARPVDEAIEELIRCRGTHFDPNLVDLFVPAVQRDGWQPAPVQQVPVTNKSSAYDHDDPVHPPQVEGSPEGTT